VTKIFLDTAYFIARVNPGDQYHRVALEIAPQIAAGELFTSQMIFVGLLNSFCNSQYFRNIASQMVPLMYKRAKVIDQSPALFNDALAVYAKHPDKGWSLTDCASLIIMDKHDIWVAAASDRHFSQMQRTILMP
jgi:predicted nucleic acid-binding protein